MRNKINFYDLSRLPVAPKKFLAILFDVPAGPIDSPPQGWVANAVIKMPPRANLISNRRCLPITSAVSAVIKLVHRVRITIMSVLELPFLHANYLIGEV